MKDCECCDRSPVAIVDVLTMHGHAQVYTCATHATDTLQACALAAVALKPRLKLLASATTKDIFDVVENLASALRQDESLETQLKAIYNLWAPKPSI